MPIPPAEALAQIRETAARMRALNSRLTQEVATSRLELARLTAELAEKRRAGELGRPWQVLQQRIDMRQTTEQDIYAGVDTSAEAREVRATLKENLTRMRAEVEELREEDPEISAATAREESARRELEARLRGTREIR